MARTRMTPFARLLLVLIVLAPLAYMGASYYNGEDGIQNIKNLIGIDKAKQTEKTVETKGNDKNISSEVTTLQQEVTELKEKVEELEGKNRQLELDLREKDIEIRELKLKE